MEGNVSAIGLGMVIGPNQADLGGQMMVLVQRSAQILSSVGHRFETESLPWANGRSSQSRQERVQHTLKVLAFSRCRALDPDLAELRPPGRSLNA